jgi:hypothetical protein
MSLGLVACSGGGSAALPTTAAPTSTLTGIAATGAAIASGSVTLKCVSGTSTAATTGTDGSFNIDASAVTLPCVGRVDYKDASGAAQKLHTFISATGTANITPVTELLVASLTGGTAVDAFDKFDATKAKAFTAAQLKAAADAVKTYLKNTLGVDTTNLPDDPVGTKFVATAGSTAGDKADKVLDDLAAKLKTGGKKLGDAVADVAKPPATGGGTGSGGGVAGGVIGSGAYSAVKADDNLKFLALVATKCTKDDALTDKDRTVYKNCNHSNLDGTDVNLIFNMWRGALPNAGTVVASGPGFATSATVASVTGLTGVATGNSCKVGIAEPYIPIIAIRTSGSENAQAGSLFGLKGTASDAIYVSARGVVLQYTMTDGTGNQLSVQFDTTTGLSTASLGNFGSGGKNFSCQ